MLPPPLLLLRAMMPFAPSAPPPAAAPPATAATPAAVAACCGAHVLHFHHHYVMPSTIQIWPSQPAGSAPAEASPRCRRRRESKRKEQAIRSEKLSGSGREKTSRDAGLDRGKRECLTGKHQRCAAMISQLGLRTELSFFHGRHRAGRWNRHGVTVLPHKGASAGALLAPSPAAKRTKQGGGRSKVRRSSYEAVVFLERVMVDGSLRRPSTTVPAGFLLGWEKKWSWLKPMSDSPRHRGFGLVALLPLIVSGGQSRSGRRRSGPQPKSPFSPFPPAKGSTKSKPCATTSY